LAEKLQLEYHQLQGFFLHSSIQALIEAEAAKVTGMGLHWREFVNYFN